jgi:curli biogenesis system outer membrane secretion channel CsgG
MKKVSLLVFFLLCGALTVFARDTLPTPQVLGKESIFTVQRLGAYNTIVVREFSTDGAELANLDDEEKKIVEEIKPTIVKNLKESLVKNLKKEGKFRNVLVNGEPKGKAIIVEGKFTRFNGGKGAAKFFPGWIGTVSGKTNISVAGRLVDAKTGKELATFSDTRSGGEWSGLGRIRGVMPIQATDEGEEIANFIHKLY